MGHILHCLLISLMCVLARAKIGDVCSDDSSCPDNAECYEDTCRCKNGFFPIDSGRLCKVALWEPCEKTTDCGVNAKCGGDPKQCKCQRYYTDENGRCGKKTGEECTENTQCIKNGYCSNNKCQCAWSYIPLDGFCGTNHECSYYLKRATLEKFYNTMSGAQYHYDVFPCRSKMAHFFCAGFTVDVTVEHGVTLKTNFNAKDSTGGVYVRDVSITLTTATSDGAVTSQTNHLNTDDYKKYLKKGDFSKTPWDWSYEGEKPRRKKRVVGTTSQYGAATVTTGPLSVTYTDSESDLDIKCYDPQFSCDGGPSDSICGFPGFSDYQVKRELESRSAEGTSVLSVIDAYIALVKQDVEQTDGTCQEAKAVLTGACPNLASAMKACSDKVYTTKWVSSPGRCLRKNSVDSFKVYVSCLKLQCGQGGKSPEDCALFTQAKDTCGLDLHTQAGCQ